MDLIKLLLPRKLRQQKQHNPKSHNNSFNINDSVTCNTGHTETWNYAQLQSKDKKFKMWIKSIYSSGDCIRCVLAGRVGQWEGAEDRARV